VRGERDPVLRVAGGVYVARGGSPQSPGIAGVALVDPDAVSRRMVDLGEAADVDVVRAAAPHAVELAGYARLRGPLAISGRVQDERPVVEAASDIDVVRAAAPDGDEPGVDVARLRRPLAVAGRVQDHALGPHGVDVGGARSPDAPQAAGGLIGRL